MAPLRSLGNALSSFRDFYARTGTDGVSAAGSESAPISVTGGNTNYTYNGKKIHVWTSPGPFVLTGGPGPVEYFVVAGGGGGGADMGGGGGGGGVLTGQLTLEGPFSTSVTVGPGGSNAARNSATPDASIGNPSVLNNPVTTVTAFGGGFGQNNTDSNPLTYPETVGSGGGGYGQSHPRSGATAPSYPGPVATQQGTPGYTTAPSNYGGGGGGAGTTAPPNGFGAQQQDGGYGIAIPATFRDPSNLYGGPNGPDQPNLGQPGKWYFAGGGCGGNPNNGNAYAGGGTVANNATASTGSGGGGGPGSGGDPGGTGATGIVFIAYTPS